jgi:hypothetical protein
MQRQAAVAAMMSHCGRSHLTLQVAAAAKGDAVTAASAAEGAAAAVGAVVAAVAVEAAAKAQEELSPHRTLLALQAAALVRQ